VTDPRESSTDKPALVEIGRAGYRRHGNWISDEPNRHLAGATGAKIFREMADNEAGISGALLAFETMLAQTSWEVRPRPKDDRPEAARVAAFVEEARLDLDTPWRDFLGELFSAATYGWSYLEVVYKIRRGSSSDPMLRSRHDDGAIGWRGFMPRAQGSFHEWRFNETTGQATGWVQRPSPDFLPRYLPLDKGILFHVRPRAGNPEGRSLLRGAYVEYYFAKRLRELEGIGATNDLAGLPIMEVPPALFSVNATPDQLAMRRMFETMLPKIQRGEYEGVVLPSELDPGTNTPTGYKFRLMQSGGRRPIDVHEIIKRHEQREMMALLSEVFLLGMDSGGSRALGDVKQSMHARALQGVMDRICDVFSSIEIPRLLSLNGIDPSLAPVLTHGDLDEDSIADMAAAISTLANSGGLSFDEADEQHFRERLKLPVKQRGAAAGAPSLRLVPPLDDAEAQLGEDRDAGADGEKVADTMPTGVQIEQARAIVGDVALGNLPRASGIEFLVSMVRLGRAEAEAIMGDIGRSFRLAPPGGEAGAIAAPRSEP
jgi:hypothetical protein